MSCESLTVHSIIMTEKLIGICWFHFEVCTYKQSIFKISGTFLEIKQSACFFFVFFIQPHASWALSCSSQTGKTEPTGSHAHMLCWEEIWWAITPSWLHSWHISLKILGILYHLNLNFKLCWSTLYQQRIKCQWCERCHLQETALQNNPKLSSSPRFHSQFLVVV